MLLGSIRSPYFILISLYKKRKDSSLIFNNLL